MSAEDKNIRFNFTAVSELSTVEEQMRSLMDLSQKQEQIVKQQAASLQASVNAQQSSLNKLAEVWKGVGDNITTVKDASAQQTATVKANLEQQTQAVKVESQKQISEAKAREAQLIANAKVAEAQQTAAAKAGANERTAAAKAAADEQIIIAKAIADQTTAEVRAALNQQTAIVRAEQDQQTAIIKGEQSRQTAMLKAELREQTGVLQEQNTMIRDFRSMVVSAFGIYEVIEFGKSVIEAKTKLDTFRSGLSQMIGSKAEANKVYEDVIELAKTTPFKIENLTETTFMLKGLGVATSELIPTLTTLGNMAAVVGEDRLPRIAKAFTDVQSKGKLMKQELNQFAENGVPLYDLLATSLGKTRDEVIKMAEAHTISFDMVKKALFDASDVGGRYYNLMALQSQTLGGQIANLADKYFVAKARIGDFFEDTVKSGIKTLNQLIDATIGSNSAIERTVSYIKTGATAYLSWKLATEAQSIASKALAAATLVQNGLTTAGTLATGTYNLVLITARGTTEGLTKAQLASAVAARGLWTALAANPIGALIALVGVATTAYMAWDAASVQVTATMGDQEYQIRKEQAELGRLTESALAAKSGTVQRKEAIDLLIAKYPEYFSGINNEKTTNNQLMAVLDNVNKSYAMRIQYAREAYNVEKLNDKMRGLWDEQSEAIGRLVERVPQLKQFGNDSVAILNYLNKNFEDFKKAKGTSFKSVFDDFVNGDPVDSFLKTKKALADVENELQSTEKRMTTYSKASRDLEANNIKSHYETLIKQAAGNSEKIKALKEEETIALAKLNGTFREKEAKAEDEGAKATKKAVSQTYIELRELKAKQGELSLEDRKKIIELEEKLEIEAVNKQKLTQRAKQEQIAAIIKEYVPKHAAIEQEIQDKKNAEILVKERELQNQIAVLQVEQLEAERIHTKLNTVQTQEERRAVMAEYGKKITDDVKQQSVDQLKAQRDASQEYLDQVRLINGEKSEAFHKANLQLLTDDKQYQAALVAQTKDAAQTALQIIATSENKIQALRRETAEITKDTVQQEKANRAEAINAVIGLFQNANPIIAGFGGAILQVFNNIDQLSGKAREEAEGRLNSAKAALSIMKDMYSQSGAEGQVFIAEAEKGVATASANVAKVGAESLASTMQIIGMVYQVASAVVDAYNQMMQETYQAIADGYQASRDVINDFYGLILEKNREALTEELANFTGSYAEREAMIRKFYAEQKVYAEGRDRIELELAYAQQSAQIRADSGDNIKKYLSSMVAAQYQHEAQKKAVEVARIEESIEMAKELRDAKIDALQDELDAFKAVQEEQQRVLEENLAKNKQATEQFYSDKELRLQEDDVYRAQLLAQGEAREVAALQAAMQRELDRATSADERTQILNAFEKLIAEKHAEYQTAIGDKTKEVSLANQEVKAQEADKITTLETATAEEITRLKEALAAKEKEVSNGMIGANAEYKEFVKSAQREIFNITKAMKIAELRAEIAILYGKRNLFNKGKINSAIDDLNEAIGSIESLSFAKGTEFVDAENRFPNGIDTVPAFLDKGERVLTRDQNKKLGSVSNKELVQRSLLVDKLMLKYPGLVGPSGFGVVPTMSVPAALLASGPSAPNIDLTKLVDQMQLFRSELARKNLVKITVDKGGINTYIEGQQSTTHYLSNLMNR